VWGGGGLVRLTTKNLTPGFILLHFDHFLFGNFLNFKTNKKEEKEENCPAEKRQKNAAKNISTLYVRAIPLVAPRNNATLPCFLLGPPFVD
jgi:hypothetical protein